MFLEICMQIHSLVSALSRQINKQKVCENSNLLCAGHEVFVKYQAQGGGLTPTPTALVYALVEGIKSLIGIKLLTLGFLEIFGY